MKHLFLTITIIVMLASMSIAEVPTTMNYQGKLNDGTGPVTGTVAMTFTIYDALTSGNSKWTETHSSVSVTDGLFNVVLGNGTPPVPILDTVISGADRWIEITTVGEIITPRTKMVSLPYSFRVATVDGASGGDISGKVTIGPGHSNTGVDAFVAGNSNTANNSYSVVTGGSGNTAGNLWATVSGGQNNEAAGQHGAIGGGSTNTASNRQTTVAGGIMNQASGEVATISGGQGCLADGNYSVVPGGWENHAGGSNSFAAGVRAKALHDYSFVWNADWSIDSLFTTGTQQFLIEAPGGVGINTNTPGYALHVEGNVDADGYSINGVPVGSSSDSYWSQSASNIYYNTGNVGIGTSNPSEKFQVNGNIKAYGELTLNSVINSEVDTAFAEIVMHGLWGDSTKTGPDGSTFWVGMDDLSSYGPDGMILTHSDDGGITYDSLMLGRDGLAWFDFEAKASYGPDGLSYVRDDDTLLKVDLSDITIQSPTSSSRFQADTSGITVSRVFDSSLFRADGFQLTNSDDGGITWDGSWLLIDGLAFYDGDDPGDPKANYGPDGLSVIWPRTLVSDSTVITADGLSFYDGDDPGDPKATYGPNDITFWDAGDYGGSYGPNGMILTNATGDTTAQYTGDGIVDYDLTNMMKYKANANGMFLIDNMTGDTTVQVTPDGVNLWDPNVWRSVSVTSSDIIFRNGSGFSDKSIELIGGSNARLVSYSGGEEMMRISNQGIVFDTTDSPNPLQMTAPGGTTIYSNTSQSLGVTLSSGGGSWESVSDRNLKENFRSIDKQDFLEKVGMLDISNWNYKSQDETIRHIGPMAQDLYAAFGLGDDEKRINTIDADGVALAAIQGLLERVKQLESENNNIKEQMAQLTTLVETVLANQREAKSNDSDKLASTR